MQCCSTLFITISSTIIYPGYSFEILIIVVFAAIIMIITFNNNDIMIDLINCNLGQVHRIPPVCGSPFKITCLKRRSFSLLKFMIKFHGPFHLSFLLKTSNHDNSSHRSRLSPMAPPRCQHFLPCRFLVTSKLLSSYFSLSF